MRHYETTYILRPNLGEEKFTEIIERTNAIIEADNGSVIDIDRWGIKKLAYEIKKETQGYYICMNYAAPGSTIQEMERIFRIDDNVLRYLTIKLDKGKEIDQTGVEQEKERIAAIAAAIVAEAEELARQNEDAENGDDKAEEKAEEKVAISEESDTPKQEQQDDSAE
ncbi:MAG: 30S ribosomal protein S6 [Candidatus Electrothrix sp. AX5]|jgi:small subunit ribosomal protein S6|uniref:Small ribosomal subunit protein bS6 n=1 Tax=Candidatus Electrothrix aarhusensis TaxID=1859131 RepID=A0A3S4T929_9BACT|nr:30S ribosomal protein S6 [Candidatus Electrothrix sp. AX5]RWX45670.1 SSU ribosomal protein S6P [Candidatus Electrothrix aarhusensis]